MLIIGRWTAYAHGYDDDADFAWIAVGGQFMVLATTTTTTTMDYAMGDSVYVGSGIRLSGSWPVRR